MSPSWGSKWMSETPRSTASVMLRCTSWMTEASSPELVRGERALREQHPVRRRARGVRRLARLVHHRPLDEAEVDQDVREHAARAATARRGRDAPLALGGCCPGLSGWIHGLGDVM